MYSRITLIIYTNILPVCHINMINIVLIMVIIIIMACTEKIKKLLKEYVSMLISGERL